VIMSAKGLSVRNLTVAFRSGSDDLIACRNLSFDVSAGVRLAIVGESGSGKTTTALALMGMLPTAGRVVSGAADLGGVDLLDMAPEDRRRIRLKVASYMPQGAMNSLNPVLRIRDQILHGLFDHDAVLANEEKDARVSGLLESVGLSPRVAGMYPHQLSGGMKQRVCIAIAASMRPALLIADEPTSALDVITQREVMETLGRTQRAIGSSLILIAHDMALVGQFADRVMVMKSGEVVEEGPVSVVFAAPRHPYTRALIDGVAPQARRVSPQVLPSDPKSDAPLLELKGVSKSYPDRRSASGMTFALAPLSFRLAQKPASVLAIVGQSGSGKSTLGSMILGLTAPDTGHIEFNGAPIDGLSGKERLLLRKDVQAVFQDPYASFNPFYRVDRSITLPMLSLGVALSKAEARSLAETACREVGLDPDAVLGRYPHQLSGGQRQRLMVARALALRPRLLVADEPVSMVDASMRAGILKSLADLRDRHGISIVYITHDLETARIFADDVLVLNRGFVVEAGVVRDVIEAPAHPYTQALIAATPSTDLSRRWLDRSEMANKDEGYSSPSAIRPTTPALTEIVVSG
jgi:peptide/nickel transport system ATP-binding protein